MLTTLTANQQATHFTYTPVGKLSKITFPDGKNHQYSYDNLGFRTQTKRSDGSSINYHYDSLGNLTTLATTDNNGQTCTQTLTLNSDNQLTQLDMTGQAPLTVKYTGKGNPKKLSSGNKNTDYHYDKLGRLIQINDSENGTSHYEYQQNEVDIRTQLDNRTRPVNSHQSKISSTNQSQSQLHYARMNGSPWQAVIWNESLVKFLVPAPETLNSPDGGYQSSKQRRRLHNATAIAKAGQYSFDKPSNAFFLSPEYQAVNCDPDYWCFIWSVDIQNTGAWVVGTQNIFSATALPLTSRSLHLMVVM